VECVEPYQEAAATVAIGAEDCVEPAACNLLAAEVAHAVLEPPLQCSAPASVVCSEPESENTRTLRQIDTSMECVRSARVQGLVNLQEDILRVREGIPGIRADYEAHLSRFTAGLAARRRAYPALAENIAGLPKRLQAPAPLPCLPESSDGLSRLTA